MWIQHTLGSHSDNEFMTSVFVSLVMSCLSQASLSICVHDNHWHACLNTGRQILQFTRHKFGTIFLSAQYCWNSTILCCGWHALSLHLFPLTVRRSRTNSTEATVKGQIAKPPPLSLFRSCDMGPLYRSLISCSVPLLERDASEANTWASSPA